MHVGVVLCAARCSSKCCYDVMPRLFPCMVSGVAGRVELVTAHHSGAAGDAAGCHPGKLWSTKSAASLSRQLLHYPVKLWLIELGK